MAATIRRAELYSADELTRELIIQLQLEDIEQLAAASKRSAGENGLPDNELALQIYNEDLNRSAMLVSDRRMTKSISLAIQTDKDALAQSSSRELSEITDRRVAFELGGQAAPNNLPQNSEASEIDDERLAILAARYNAQPTEVEESEAVEGSVCGGIAESMVSNRRGVQDERRRCEACSEQKKLWQTARTPCGHDYCQSCLQELFNSAMTDESLFPPRCCRQPILPAQMHLHLTPATIEQYHEKKTEFETPNRTYCSLATCSRFLRADEIDGDVATCLDCTTATCTICKNGTHEGDCPADANLQLLLDTARENGWQRCSSCRRMISLGIGCNHIICPCSAQFCYLCGLTWKTCGCAQWNERMLLERGQQIIDRQPHGGRRVGIAAAVRNLRERHDCGHDNWEWIRGSHTCEECHEVMPEFIFDCRQCHLRTCRRCRDNRL